MLEEIREQPRALERTLAEAVRGEGRLRAKLEKLRPRLIVMAARGTSDNAAQFGRYLLETMTGIPVSLAAPSVHTLYKAKLDLRETLLIAVSQSGESTDVNAVLEAAKAQGAFAIGVTNEAESAMARLADHTVLVRAGKERSVAATKTYTGQLMAMYLIAHALGAKLRLSDLERLPEWTSKALQAEKSVAAQAARYRFMERAVVVGRGLNYSNAFEMALKLMETCYVVAERFSPADLLHGPIAMVEAAFPSFLFAPSGVTWTPLSETLAKLHELKAETFTITDRANKETSSGLQHGVALPFKLPELYTTIPYIVPAQLLAAHLAVEKGLNPDQPRTLSKVTKTL